MNVSVQIKKYVQLAGLILVALVCVVLLLFAMPASATIDSTSFAAKVDFTTNPGPTSVALGDLNADGLPDMAVSNYGTIGSIGSTIAVFKNTTVGGVVSYTRVLTLTANNGPIAIKIGDIDGDSKPDLVVTNFGEFGSGNTVSVFRNTGAAGNFSFDPKVDFTTYESGPRDLAIGDLDGDGKPDLAVTDLLDGAGSTVSIFRNTSTSPTVSFSAPVTVTTGTAPEGIAIGDIDGDGKADLAVDNYSPNSVSVFRNKSTVGNLSFDPKVDLNTDTGPRGVAIGDFDGDGKSDLAVTNYLSNTVSIFHNTSVSGTVTFDPKILLTTGNGPVEITAKDFDKNGKLDLAVTDFGATEISVFGNTSTVGNVSFAAKVDFATGNGPHGIAVGDVDVDTWPDVAVTNYGSGYGTTVSILRNTSSGAPTATDTPTPTATDTPTPTATDTPTPTPTNTPTPTPTNTPTPTPTDTPTPTNTPTATATDTPTATATNTPTSTATNTPTATATNTPTPTSTPTTGDFSHKLHLPLLFGG